MKRGIILQMGHWGFGVGPEKGNKAGEGSGAHLMTSS